MRILLWWLLFTVLCIWVQAVIPGLDCFGPALLVLIHLQRSKEAAWLTPLWIVINEGTGSLAFGMSILWLGGLLLIFVVLCLYLTSSNLVFVITLSLLAGVWQFGVSEFMTALQELSAPEESTLVQGVKTAALFPLLWTGLHAVFTRWGQSRHVPS